MLHPIRDSLKFGVHLAANILGPLDTFEAWEKRTTRQIVLESVPPYPTIIIHVTYEGETPDHQAAVRKAVKGLLTSLLQDEALSESSARWKLTILHRLIRRTITTLRSRTSADRRRHHVTSNVPHLDVTVSYFGHSGHSAVP